MAKSVRVRNQVPKKAANKGKAKAKPKPKAKVTAPVIEALSDVEDQQTVSDLDDDEGDGSTGNQKWTPAQLAHLNGTFEGYMEARITKRKGLNPFWKKSLDGLLKVTVINPKLSSSEKAKVQDDLKERLKQWYNNAGRRARLASQKVLNLQPKRAKRKRTPWRVYLSRKKEALQPYFLEEWKTHEEYDPSADIPINVKNKVAMERFADEDEDVREEMTARANGEWQGDDDDEEEEEEELSPEEQRQMQLQGYQDAIDLLPNTLVAMFEEIQKQTNFIGSITLVGPEPKRGGKLTRIHYANGKTEIGAELGDLFSEAVRDHALAMLSFGGKVFDPETRRSFALEDDGSTTRVPAKSRTASSSSSRSAGEGSSSAGGSTAGTSEATTERESRRSTATATGERAKRTTKKKTSTATSESSTPTQTPTQLTPSATVHPPDDDISNEDEHRDIEPEASEEAISAEPEWLQGAVTYLEDAEGLSSWDDLVQALRDFEKNEGYPLAKTSPYVLSATQRPDELSQWIRAGRKHDAAPKLTVEGVPAFAKACYSWWMSLQPPDRLTTPFCPDGILSCAILKKTGLDDEDFADVCKGSINGIYGVICCLRWWMEATDNYHAHGFSSLVQDVLWLLRHLVSSREARAPISRPPNSRKRAAPSTDEGPRSKKPRSGRR